MIARGEFGERTVRFHGEEDLFQEFEKIGHVPLPPYIKRADEPADRERYQTVFAREKGSVAAPTAGLHFTPEILEACRARGAEVACVTLHVGLGTFQPLHAERVEDGRLHAERYQITEENAAKMRAARRVVAVGTTSVRTIESAWPEGRDERGDGYLYLSGVSVPRGGSAADQFPPAADELAAAGVRVRGDGIRPGGLPSCGRDAVPVLFVRRLHVGCCEDGPVLLSIINSEVSRAWQTTKSDGLPTLPTFVSSVKGA